MQHIKGFVSINHLVNNVPGEDALIGELSTWSLTYSKEKGEYQHINAPGYKLITFKSVDAITGEVKEVPGSLAHQALMLVKFIIQYSNAHIYPFDTDDFRETIVSEFHGSVHTFEHGSFVNDGYTKVPEWVSWRSAINQDAFIKIWLTDQAFSDQFDDYEIVTVPPIIPLDDFFGFYNDVVERIQQRSMEEMGDAIMEHRNRHPDTYLRFLTFDFINRNNPQQKTPTTWAVLIYGRAGDNIDAIKDAIIEYILENSDRPREDWEKILPDLFKRTEFLILPRWDQIAVPNLTELSALYKSIMDPIECINFAAQNLPYYSPGHVQSNTYIMPYDYKAITLLVINGMSNVDDKKDFAELFPDYIPVPSTSPDFNRMQIRTRTWGLMLQELLILAETATQFTTIPYKFRRIKRDGHLYITAMYENVHYLVAARSNDFYGYQP